MTKHYFHEKITLYLSFLILSNYLFLSLNLPLLIIKINFLLFLTFIIVFYFKNFSDNLYLKIFFFIIIIISLGTPTIEWDPRSIWLFHAKRIFYDSSIFSVADNYASFSHNDYPSLVPAFSSSLAFLFGYWNEVFPKISFSLIFLPPLIFTYAFFKETNYLIFLSFVFLFIGKYLFNGWADGLIAIYFCLSVFLMYLLIIDNNKFNKNKLYNLIAFCFFVSLTLIKNEGLALLTILFLVTLFIKLYKRELKEDYKQIIYLSLSILPIILWKYFCYTKGIGNDYINSNFVDNLLLRYKEFDNYKLIGYFLLLNEKFLISFIFFSLAFIIKKNKELFIYILIIVILYVLVLSIIFLSTPVDFYFQLNSAAARVVKTLSFLMAFFGLFNLSNIKLSN